MTPDLGVIGLGRMARALVEPLLQRGELNPEGLIAVVGRSASIEPLSRQLPSGVHLFSADAELLVRVWTAPLQLLAIKPSNSMRWPQRRQRSQPATAHFRARRGQPGAVAAPVSWTSLRPCCAEHAGPGGAGLTALAWGDDISPESRSRVRHLFASVSEVLELPEPKLDAFLALTSSGPAFVAVVAEAMADGAVAAGLSRDQALHLTHRTLAGTAALLQDRQLHPAQLKDMVSSPGGTTIAGLRRLEQAGLRSALIEAVLAAAERSRELA